MAQSWRISVGRLVVLFVAWGSLGCAASAPDPRPREGETVVLDLAADWDLVDVARQVTSIDLGTTAARSHLGEGWSWDEVTGGETTFVWSIGDRSTVRFHLVADQSSLVVVGRLWSFTFPGAAPQAVTWRLDGREVVTTDLTATPAEVRVDLGPVPAGRHRLTLEPSWHREVRTVLGGDDPRSLAVGVDWLRFEKLAGAADLPRANDGVVAVPAATEVSAFLRSGKARRLVATGVTLRDGDGGLEVLATVDASGGERSTVLARVDADDERRALDIDLPTSEGPLRLSVRVVGTGTAVLRGARVLGPSGAEPEPASDPERPVALPGRNVVLYVIDTLRADRLGFHGHRRGVSPRLDGLAARSIVFERAIAQSSWTKSTMASVLTGLGPLTHGIRGPEHRLDDQATTLAEQLVEAGWWTAAVSTNAHLTAESGFAQGFDVFETLFDEGSQDASAVTAWGLEQLDRRAEEQPFFLWLHVMEPHAPYAPPEIDRRRFAPTVEDRWLGSVEHVRALGDKRSPATDDVVDALLDLYDAEIAATDRAFGALLDGLEARGLTDDTVVVVLADHGEAFRERGVFGHGWDLHAEVLDVPFVLHVPGLEPRRIDQPVQQIDLPPTLFDLLGLSGAKSPGQGTSLWPLIRGGVLAPRPLIAAMDYEGRAGLAVVDGRFKWITPRSVDFGPPRLYDLVADPGEHHDLLDERPVLAGWLESVARRAERIETEAATVDLDPETRRRLEALGYL